MVIHKYAPSAPLRYYIQHYWYMTGNIGAKSVQIRDVPDGNPEVILNFGSPFYQQGGSTGHIPIKHGAIKAQFNHPVMIRQSGQINILGISFKPEGLYHFLKTNLFLFRNQVTPLERLIGDDLYDRLYEEITLENKLLILEDSLLKRLSKVKLPNPVILESLSKVRLSTKNITIRQLCTDLKVSTKQLERLYKKEIGTTPKQLFDLIRIKKVLTALRHKPVDWMQLVVNFGYHDQSHLCHDFQRFIDLPPTNYLLKNDRFSGHYQYLNGNVDFLQ